MAAPSAPVIQGVAAAYWLGSNVHAEWYEAGDVTACSATMEEEGGATQTKAATLVSSGYTTHWKVSFSPVSAGRYVISATATNGDGTSDAGTVEFAVYDYPAVTLSPADGSTVTGLPLVVSWVISDQTGVAAQTLRVTDSDGDTVWASGLASDVRAVTLYAWDLAGIEDGEGYSIWLDLTNGAGLQITVHNDVTTGWVPPATPTLGSLTVDPSDMSARLVCSSGALTSMSLVRVDPSGVREVLAEDAGDALDHVDRLAPLGAAYSYEVVATDTQTGVPSVALVVPSELDGNVWAVNAGPAAETCVLLGRNPSESVSRSHGGELYHMADGGAGGGLPVWYGTGERTVSGQLEAEAEDESVARALEGLADGSALVWVRSPFGDRWRAVAEVTVQRTRRSTKASVSWEATRWEGVS